jgi:L-ascorbate metabolism protein UlaG (beta-lactamase superfamily)
MKKEKLKPAIARILFAVVIIAAGALLYLLSPSGDINDFQTYFLAGEQREPQGDEVKVTFLGTSTLLFEDAHTQLMVDAFISRPGSIPVLLNRPLATETSRVDEALMRAKVQRDKLKAVFVTHSHYDHAQDLVYIARTTGARVFGSSSTLNIGRGGALEETQMTAFTPGVPLPPFDGFTVTIYKSRHSPATPANDDLGVPISEPLCQPATRKQFTEGGTFDVLIRHGGHSILVKSGANYVFGGLDGVHADVLFLGTARLAKQCTCFEDRLYEQTVGVLHPSLVIPVHWDDFFSKLSGQLSMSMRIVDDVPAAFKFLIGRLREDHIRFGIMQGYQSVVLFGKGSPDASAAPSALAQTG